MSDVRLNDAAWEQLFQKYNILERIEKEGFATISATQIKEFREPRLMVKFDHAINLPALFAKNQLSILPVTRGDYVISHFEAYHRFEPFDSQLVSASLPAHIQSLDSSRIPSEAIALNCAFASGIIADFMEDVDVVPTVSGRMGSGVFTFEINDTNQESSHRIDVSNSQIEIDAAYEGVSSLALIEAKRELAEDFLVRQLYYPFRVWNDRVEKPVKPIFLVYSNGIYRLFEYAFDNPDHYGSLRLVKQRNYCIEDMGISVADIQSILDSVSIVEEPSISFPQADKFERIVNLCELVNLREMSRTDVTENYDFDSRQTNYYTDAARYLGLLEKNEETGAPWYKISAKGKRILGLEFKRRQLEYCRCILSHRAFHEPLCRYFQNGEMPSILEIVGIMKQLDLYGVASDATFARRASTIRSWLNWIVALINE